MKGEVTLRHQFVEFIPEEIEDGVVYVSIHYATVTHKCCCGCGEEVSTPLSPTDWKLIYDGRTVTLDPSIGNWNFKCRSHYWIHRDRAVWAQAWSQEMIDSGRALDRHRKEQFYERAESSSKDDGVSSSGGLGAQTDSPSEEKEAEKRLSLLQRFMRWLGL